MSKELWCAVFEETARKLMEAQSDPEGLEIAGSRS